ncbi:MULTISPECIES: hypothetical protein [unclassified Microbacterium]|uniref:hypothetical protein n=1 Tax=unclassified Microbacterium TaxID=2609290 RepID=UPI0036647A26
MPDMAVPKDTVAVVLFTPLESGELQASYAEIRDRVPVTREQVIDALLRLAVAIENQKTQLDDAERGT